MREPIALRSADGCPQGSPAGGGCHANCGSLAGVTINASGALAEILVAQSGVISRQQVLALGISAAVVDNKLRYRRWQRLQQGVYATFTGRPDRMALLWAVVLRAGPFAALSFSTAAELYGLAPRPAQLIHVTVPRNQRIRPIPGAVVHYSHRLDQSRHPVLLPPRTRIEDTVLDLAQVAPRFEDAFDWLCRAIGRRLTTPAELRSALQGRPRAKRRAELMIALADVADGAQSNLELRYVRKVERAHGLPTARRQAKIVSAGHSRYVDNLYEDAQLAVELDGRATHPPEQRWDDSHRDNDHASLGIMTVRYNWQDVNYRPCAVAAQVAGLLRMRGTAVQLRRCGGSCAVLR